LVAGGASDFSTTGLASAELYDPATGTFATTGSMNTPRWFGQTATLLRNGQVLVAGGLSTGYADPVPSAELYNPATGTFSATGSMITTRESAAATLLTNGQVLVVGGCSSNNGTNPCQLVAGAELYDPATRTFSATGSLITARTGNTATLLPDGQVLVAGGITSPFDTILASAELYNPATGTFSTTGSMTTARSSPAATLLPNGQVLVSGGSIPGSNLTTAELYSPTTGTFSSTGSMTTPNESATLLLDGQVLVAGGSIPGSNLATAELYDPTTGTFSATGSMITARSSLLATLLHNGQVLVAGGVGSSGPLASAELYTATLDASGLNGSNCNGEYTGTYRGNLTVSNGQVCIFSDGGVTGNLTQTGGTVVLESSSFVNGNLQASGGSLSLSNSAVGNDLQITGAVTFSIGPAVSICGNLQIQGLPVSANTDEVCGTSVRGNLTFQNSGTAVQLGSGPGCAGNIVGGDLSVQSNTASTAVDSNSVGGNLTDQNNTGASQVFSNAVTKNLQCNGDSSITGGGNTASSKQGQCAKF